MRLSDNVKMLEITNDRGTLYPVLLWDDADVILIDTGLPGQLELLQLRLWDFGGAGFS